MPTMHSLKFANILPVVQFFLAVTLLVLARGTPEPRGLDTPYLSTAALVCYGLNAPALLVKFVGMLVVVLTNRPMSIHTWGIEDVWFLGGVVIVWYLIGRTLDRFRSLGGPQEPRKLSSGEIIVNLLLFLLGSYFFYLAIDAFLVFGKWNNPKGNITEGVLFLAWSLTLILLPATKLLNAIRASRAGGSAFE